MIGQRYGNWLVLGEYRTEDRKYIRLKVQCDCGKVKDVDANSVKKGKSKSCGCVRDAAARASRDPNAVSNHDLIAVWRMMKARCQNPKNNSYANYGGRGIKVDPRWEDFHQFVADMGPKPFAGRECSIERVDNNGPYSPDNCVWSDRIHQSRNKRTTAWVTVDGQTKSVAEWAQHYGIKQSTVSSRINAGMTPAQALTHRLKFKAPKGVKRPVIRFEWNGKPTTARQWCLEVGMPYKASCLLLRSGVSPEWILNAYKN